MVMKIFISCVFPLAAILLTGSCHKNELAPDLPKTTGSVSLDTVYRPVEPVVAASVGFFLEDWQPKTFLAPTATNAATVTSTTPTDTIAVDMNKVITKVPTYLFGNNINSWMGQMVTGTNGNPTLLQYIRDLNPHVLRFPGGSISDVYFWNAPPELATGGCRHNDL